MCFNILQVSKSVLRTQIAAEIAALSEEYVIESDEKLYQKVSMLDEFIAARNIFVYCSVKREPSTLKIVDAALSMGKTVAFPLCHGRGIMDARVAGSINDLQLSMLGIPAPSEAAAVVEAADLDLVIVPALTYDRRGYRLGYGGGYYDRYLQGISAFTIGLARESLIKDALPIRPHDISVKCVITETRVFYPK